MLRGFCAHPRESRRSVSLCLMMAPSVLRSSLRRLCAISMLIVDRVSLMDGSSAPYSESGMKRSGDEQKGFSAPRWPPSSIDRLVDRLATTTSFLVCLILVCFALLLRVLRLVLTHLTLGSKISAFRTVSPSPQPFSHVVFLLHLGVLGAFAIAQLWLRFVLLCAPIYKSRFPIMFYPFSLPSHIPAP